MKLEKLTKRKINIPKCLQSAYQNLQSAYEYLQSAYLVSAVSIPFSYKVHYNIWCDGEPAEIIPPGQIDDLSEANATMQPRLKRPGRDNRKRSTGREKPVSEITGSSTRPHGQSSTSGVLDGTKLEGAVPW